MAAQNLLAQRIPPASVKTDRPGDLPDHFEQLDGWYNTRLPYVPGCQYLLRRSDLNDGRYEFTAGSQLYWYNAGLQ